MVKYGLSLLQCIQSQTFHSTDCITANFSNSFPVHDHMDYFSHLCYIKVCQLFTSPPLFLLLRNKSQILKQGSNMLLFELLWIEVHMNYPLPVNLYTDLLCFFALQITEIRTVAPAFPPYIIYRIQCDCTAWKQISPTTPGRLQEMHKTSQCLSLLSGSLYTMGISIWGQQHHLWWHISAQYTNTDPKTKLLTQIPMWKITDRGLLLL